MQMEKSYYLNCNQNIILFASLSIRSNLIEKFDGGHREEMDKSHVLFSYWNKIFLHVHNSFVILTHILSLILPVART